MPGPVQLEAATSLTVYGSVMEALHGWVSTDQVDIAKVVLKSMQGTGGQLDELRCAVLIEHGDDLINKDVGWSAVSSLIEAAAAEPLVGLSLVRSNDSEIQAVFTPTEQVEFQVVQ